jgi:hypothetical protein
MDGTKIKYLIGLVVVLAIVVLVVILWYTGIIPGRTMDTVDDEPVKDVATSTNPKPTTIPSKVVTPKTIDDSKVVVESPKATPKPVIVDKTPTTTVINNGDGSNGQGNEITGPVICPDGTDMSADKKYCYPKAKPGYYCEGINCYAECHEGGKTQTCPRASTDAILVQANICPSGTIYDPTYGTGTCFSTPPAGQFLKDGKLYGCPEEYTLDGNKCVRPATSVATKTQKTTNVGRFPDSKKGPTSGQCHPHDMLWNGECLAKCNYVSKDFANNRCGETQCANAKNKKCGIVGRSMKATFNQHTDPLTGELVSKGRVPQIVFAEDGMPTTTPGEWYTNNADPHWRRNAHTMDPVFISAATGVSPTCADNSCASCLDGYELSSDGKKCMKKYSESYDKNVYRPNSYIRASI